MKQLTQKLRSGEMTVEEFPWPQVGPGRVLVRNHFSLISPGTESSTVRTARKSLLGKAKERPQQAKQVLEATKTLGPVQTYRAVVKRLEAHSPLGYSTAGEVIEVASDVRGFSVGDRVACSGIGYASHAEIVSVPQNLCVKLKPDAELKHACFNTLGAIALQGIRQAELVLGESCAVIGLGLIGQLTCLLLRAAGVKVFGIDIDPAAVSIAQEHSCDHAWLRNETTLPSHIGRLTSSQGVDAVIITAGTSSLDPINFAGEIVRKRGRVIIVGAVPTGFDRDPHWYRKELDLRMSCSYGPGRYEPDYEEKGLDYPAAYVRWTENRNMQAFQDLLQTGKLDLGYLTTHEFPLDDAPQAYDLIINRSEHYLGVVLRYDVGRTLGRTRVEQRLARAEAIVNIAFVGAGSYAQSHLLPNIRTEEGVVALTGVMTASGTTSKGVADRYGFAFCTSEPGDIFGSSEVNTVFIATRHDTHAHFVVQALSSGKNVFVEKPLCLTPKDLESIEAIYAGSNGSQLMVGFNRRFAPASVDLKRRLGGSPLSMLYRINAGRIPKESWIQDRELGGGRIVGEVCHFVDLLTWLCGAVPVRVHAFAVPFADGLNDNVCINLAFADGSIGSIGYFSDGSKDLPKEHVEVFGGGVTGIIRDFKGLEVYSSGRPYRKKSLSQDKGQANMVRAFLEGVGRGGPPVIPPEEIFSVTRATFAVLESLRTREAVAL